MAVWGIEELDTIGNMTIPRAVSYAAGFINFFFRGALTLSPPDSGIYGIVNHGTPHEVSEGGVPYLLSDTSKVFGFEAIRVKVKNTTPKITDPGYEIPISQTAGGDGSKIVAIARYHRNLCYQPDLSGELSLDSAGGVHQGCPTASMRSAFPEISVSAEQQVVLGALDGDQPVEMQFDFSGDPIPVNASDLFIQVAYRGPLGNETDGIAVGSIDVSEPSYEDLLAMTDIPLQYQEDGSTWKWSAWDTTPWSSWTSPNTGTTTTRTVPDDVQDLTITNVEICDGPWQIFHSAANEQLPKDHIVRVAAIRDFTTHTIVSQATFQGQFSGASSVGSYTRAGEVNQQDDEKGKGGGHVTYLFYGRGMVANKSFAYIDTCVDSYPGSICPTPSDPLPSPWDRPPSSTALPDIPNRSGGFVSENIGGQAILPITSGYSQTSACTISGSYMPYARRNSVAPIHSYLQYEGRKSND